MIDNPLCMLAIEERPNSFFPIDIRLLDIGVSSASMTLRDLDHLLFLYPEDFIRQRIKENNIVPESNFEAPFVILYDDDNNKKRKLPIISEESYFHGNLKEQLFGVIENKNIINHLVNKINLLMLDEIQKKELISLLKDGYIEEFFLLCCKLPYGVYRVIFIDVTMIINKQNKRVREKLSEVE